MNRAYLRENVFRLLYCNEFHDGEEMPKQYDLYLENIGDIAQECDHTVISSEIESGVSEQERRYITEKVEKIAAKTAQIDEEINQVAKGWKTDRMSKVDLIILRLAYFEMKFDEDIPEKVAIDQAVELAKKYGSDSSPSFVNGILAKLY